MPGTPQSAHEPTEAILRAPAATPAPPRVGMTTHPLTSPLAALAQAVLTHGIPAVQTADPAGLIRGLNEARTALAVPLALLAPRLPTDIQEALLDWRIEAGNLHV